MPEQLPCGGFNLVRFLRSSKAFGFVGALLAQLGKAFVRLGTLLEQLQRLIIALLGQRSLQSRLACHEGCAQACCRPFERRVLGKDDIDRN